MDANDFNALKETIKDRSDLDAVCTIINDLPCSQSEKSFMLQIACGYYHGHVKSYIKRVWAVITLNN